jgi:peptide/nickel transport system substrate-binding protein
VRRSRHARSPTRSIACSIRECSLRRRRRSAWCPARRTSSTARLLRRPASPHADRLTIRLTKPTGNFLALLAGGAGGFCLVPENLPIDPEGARAPLPSAGPYYVSAYVPGRLVVLARNRFYKGRRPHHVSRFVGDLSFTASDPGLAIDRVEAGTLDYAVVPITGDRAEELRRRHGTNKSRFFMTPGSGLRMFVLNTSRPLFKNNVRLRQAVNFAVNRRAIMRELGPASGYLTDQYMAPGLPGFRNEHIYPLERPDVARARLLAKGHLRSGRAVMYTQDGAANAAQAQILQRNLAAIGLDVEIKMFPGLSLFQKLATQGEPFDIGRVRWLSELPAPSLLNDLFDGRTIGRPDNINWSYFNSPKVQPSPRCSLEARGRARPLSPVRRARRRDLETRGPAIPLAYENVLTLVSRRTACVVLNPSLDLAAVCLR